MDKIKMLQMIDTYYPTVDGAINVCNSYAEELNKIATCDLASASAARADKYVDSKDFKVIRCAATAAPDKYRYAHPFTDSKFKKQLESGGYDIIHCHSPFSIGKYAVSLGKKMNIPVVLTLHTKYYSDFFRVTHSKFLSNLMVKYIISTYNKADSVWTVSNASMQTLRDYGYKGKIEVIRNGTDYTYPDNPQELIDKINQTHNLAGKKNVFFFVGRMAMYKNLKLLADALKIVKEAGKDFTMLFVGGGFDLEEFKKYVFELGLDDKCIFTGQISDRTLLQGYYLRGDLMLFPSTFDMASISKVESAAHKKPSLVIKDSCSAEEVVDGQNGFLCEENAESLAKRICELCDKPEYLKTVGEEAYKTLYRTWEDVAAEVYAKYLEIIENYKKN